LEVIVTGKASRDLDERLSRIEADNPAAVEAFQRRISTGSKSIRQHPQAGHRHPKRREIHLAVLEPGLTIVVGDLNLLKRERAVLTFQPPTSPYPIVPAATTSVPKPLRLGARLHRYAKHLVLLRARVYAKRCGQGLA
jgi:plasmid stabilization system protein ParE